MIVEAAAQGLIDFSRARFFDKAWGIRLGLILRGLHESRLREAQTAIHQHHLNLLTISRISDESADRLQAECSDDLHELLNRLQPWAAKTKEAQERDQVKGLMTAWEQRWGDMNSPDVQARIDATAAALRAYAAQTGDQDPIDTRGIYNAKTARVLEQQESLRHAPSPTRH